MLSKKSTAQLNSKPHLHKLPLEILTKIVRYLSLNDILSLTSVSKDWRCIYLNQNVIWRDVCERLSVKEEDFTRCLTDISRNDTHCREYMETKSSSLFGPFCTMWSTFNRHNEILRNIKNNDFPTIHIPRKYATVSLCTDDYIVNVYPFKMRHQMVQITNLADYNSTTSNIYLILFDDLYEILRRRKYHVNLVGNKKYLVFESHSILFVYKIENYMFVLKYCKVIQRSTDPVPEKMIPPSVEFFNNHSDTVIDINDDKLALVHPNYNTILLIDLESGDTFKELVYSNKESSVDCMKYIDERVMIGFTPKENDSNDHKSFAVVYHLDQAWNNDNRFLVSLNGAVSKFKVNHNFVGIENKASATPFIVKATKFINIFWIDCDTFSFDYTRKFIYYNINKSIYQYDLKKSRHDRYEVTQKILIDAISNRFSLTTINDRFLLVRSITPNAYEIFDVRERVTVRSIKMSAGFSLVHVGKLSIIFSNSKEFLVVSLF